MWINWDDFEIKISFFFWKLLNSFFKQIEMTSLLTNVEQATLFKVRKSLSLIFSFYFFCSFFFDRRSTYVILQHTSTQQKYYRTLGDTFEEERQITRAISILWDFWFALDGLLPHFWMARRVYRQAISLLLVHNTILISVNPHDVCVYQTATNIQFISQILNKPMNSNSKVNLEY